MRKLVQLFKIGKVMGKSKGISYYAVKTGRETGIFNTWSEAESSVKGYGGAVHKSFKTLIEAKEYLGLEIESKKRERPMEASSSKRIKREIIVSKIEIEVSSKRRVYCDGSALGNGTRGSQAGIGIFWVNEGGRSKGLAERLPGPQQTNNRAEMFAVARILEMDPTPNLPLTICSDSEYTINVFDKWIKGWMKNGFTSAEGDPVKNRDLILYIYSLLQLRTSAGKITFEKVRAHSGIYGNEQADHYAKRGASMQSLEERDYKRETANNRRTTVETRERVDQEKYANSTTQVDLLFDVVDGDLLTAEELREMEMSQDFD